MTDTRLAEPTTVGSRHPIEAEHTDGVVEVRFDDGARARFHALALRDLCPCRDCRHPVSGQRLFESGEVLPAARVVQAGVHDGTLAVDWEGGHASRFPAEWLAAEASAAAAGRRPARAVRHWDARLTSSLPTAEHDRVREDAAARARWLAAVAEYGFAVLTGAPASEGSVAAVAELFGPVRETNYGRVFDVTARADATNLADTALPLSLHTDNPYRSPAPTLQLLACLASSVEGGESVLVDGFRAVSVLDDEAPELLMVLAATPIRYAYRDDAAELEADAPVVALDTRGDPVALHLNNRAKGAPLGSPEEVARWYRAYLRLLAIVGRPDLQVVFRLEPGEVLVFDNGRVLHGRTGFAGEGVRRLQGCYADRDALLSALAVLERGLA